MNRVKTLIGDIFESKAQTLVNTANTVGVMGKGLALEFRTRFPDMYEDYLFRVKHKQFTMGHPYLFKRLVPPWILVFPTKDHWRSVSKLSDIETGLEHLRINYRNWGITSLAVPPLGCGLGQLEWEIVGPTLFRHLAEMDIPVELYAPEGTPLAEITPAFLSRPSEAQLVEAARNGTSGIAPTVADSSLTTASVAIGADNTNKGLSVTITPPTSVTVNASGVFLAAEM